MIEVSLYFPEGNWNDDIDNKVIDKLRFAHKIKLPIIPEKGMSIVLDDFLCNYNFTIEEKIIFLNATRNEQLTDEKDYLEYLESTHNWEWLQFEITHIFIHQEHLELWLKY